MQEKYSFQSSQIQREFFAKRIKTEVIRLHHYCEYYGTTFIEKQNSKILPFVGSYKLTIMLIADTNFNNIDNCYILYTYTINLI